uniref:Odorant receptor n=1 Tax=Eogystia hippophaecolus TaxID=1206364 RepID=A0A1B3P5M8_EOGHI|nr:odorant receptor [Eogystia hippophaecolus]
MFFFKENDMNTIKRPQDLRYMKQLQFSLNIVSAWPHKETGDAGSKFVFWWRLYYAFVEGFFWFLGAAYLKNNYGKISFFEFGHTLITHFMNTIACQRLTLPFMKKYRDFIGLFVKQFHLFHYKDKSDYAMKIYLRVYKLSDFFSMYLHILMYIGIVLFNGTPIYKNILSNAYSSNKPENVTFQHSTYFELPIDYKHSLTGYVPLFCFNWYITFICASFFCMFDLLLTVIVLNVYGHLKILVYHLEHFMTPSTNSTSHKQKNVFDIMQFSEEEMKTVTIKLKEVISHQRLITDFIQKMSDIFGPMVCLNLMYQQVSACILLLECSQMDLLALLSYGPLTFFVFQELIQLSVVFELIGATSDDLIDAVYSVPWECMDTKNRKILYTIMIKSQMTTKFKAMGMVDVGVKTMAAILKTIISYFVMLRTVALQN